MIRVTGGGYIGRHARLVWWGWGWGFALIGVISHFSFLISQGDKLEREKRQKTLRERDREGGIDMR